MIAFIKKQSLKAQTQSETCLLHFYDNGKKWWIDDKSTLAHSYDGGKFTRKVNNITYHGRDGVQSQTMIKYPTNFSAFSRLLVKEKMM